MNDWIRPTANADRPKAPLERIIAFHNANSNQIESVLCEHVDIDGRSQGKPFTLNGKLAYQRPDRFRLTGYFMSNTEVDLGSNPKEIWFWFKRSEPPAVYFCDRDALANVKLATPFQPHWLIEVLGVLPIDPDDYHEGRYSDERILTLVADERTPAGERVTKRLVIDRATNRIAAYQVFDMDNKLLVQAKITGYVEDPGTRASVPRQLEISWPDAETIMTITLARNKTSFNAISPAFAAQLFQRGKYELTEEIDLARLDPQTARRDLSPEPAPAVQTVDPYDRAIQRVSGGAQLTGQITPAPVGQ